MTLRRLISLPSLPRSELSARERILALVIGLAAISAGAVLIGLALQEAGHGRWWMIAGIAIVAGFILGRRWHEDR